MNEERIDKLAYEAGCHRHKYWDPKHPDLEGFIINQETLEKFAELIARDCIDILLRPGHVMTADDLVDLSPYNEGWVRGRLLGIEHIKKHFGVEK